MMRGMNMDDRNLDRRHFLRALGAAATAAAVLPAMGGSAQAAVNRGAAVTHGGKYPSRAHKAPEVVAFPDQYGAGTVVISLSRKRLYLTLGGGSAIEYPVAVGKSGKAWTGAARIAEKQANPAWAPPADVKRDNPNLPDLIPGGAPNNPMGPRAIVLDRAEIAIHGTTPTMRKSIGSAASYGCIRMYNEDVVDLFDRVSVGTTVFAIA